MARQNVFRRPTYSTSYIEERFVSSAPGCDCLGVSWKSEQFTDRRPEPINWPQDNWNYPDLAFGVALQRGLHFPAITIVGVQKVGADEQQCEVRGCQLLLDFLVDVGARHDLAVVPTLD